MSQGMHGKRRRAVSDWVVHPLEGRVLLSNASGLAKMSPAQVARIADRLSTTTTLQASTQTNAVRPSVTLTAGVLAPGISRPVGVGQVRFTVVSPTPENLGTARLNPRGGAKLTTSRLVRGETYIIQAQYIPPGGSFSPSSGRLDVTVADSAVTAFRIRAPQYFGAPGFPVTYSVTAVDRAGRPVTNYTGTVQFVSTTDHAAKFLAKTYTFTTADHGRHEFPDNVTFDKGGAEVVKVHQVNNTRIDGTQAFGIE